MVDKGLLKISWLTVSGLGDSCKIFLAGFYISLYFCTVKNKSTMTGQPPKESVVRWNFRRRRDLAMYYNDLPHIAGGAGQPAILKKCDNWGTGAGNPVTYTAWFIQQPESGIGTKDDPFSVSGINYEILNNVQTYDHTVLCFDSEYIAIITDSGIYTNNVDATLNIIGACGVVIWR